MSTRQDHPRSRGEYTHVGHGFLLLWGSSPLSRGILPHTWQVPFGLGIIPALAGNTLPAHGIGTRRWDHPRSRGEYHTSSAYRATTKGSSPLSRGIPRGSRNDRCRGRDHPRSRGEYFLTFRFVEPKLGIIPALAGNTRRLGGLSYYRRDHPRSRGEYGVSLGRHRGQKGSSPLSRGIHRHEGTLHRRRRIIPALAGNTQSQERGKVISLDHPRSRGEYPLLRDAITAVEGSSPLSRGILLAGLGKGLYDGIIPALAGNTGFPRYSPAAM